MKIFIVDANLLFREGLTNLLQHEPGLEVVGEASSIFEAYKIIHAAHPNLILLDTELPDFHEYNGIRLLHAQYPQAQIVLLCPSPSEELLMFAVRNGARGLISKSRSLSNLMASIRALQRGEAVIPRTLVGRLLEEFNQSPGAGNTEAFNTLTRRETEVLRELGNGCSNRQISHSLDISENTVKVHVHNVLEKLSLRNRRQAGRFARTLKLTEKHSV